MGVYKPGTGDVFKGIFLEKGQIIVGTGEGTWKLLNIGSQEDVLAVDVGQDCGVAWKPLADIVIDVIDGGVL